MGDEVLMPVPKAEGLVLAEIEAMRAITDNLKLQSKMLEQQGRAFEKMDEKVDDILIRVTRIEEQESKKRLDSHDAQIKALQLNEARLRGVFLPLVAIGSTILGSLGAIFVHLALKII